MRKHVDILGYLFIAFGGLGLLIGAILFILIMTGALLAQDSEALHVMAGIAVAVGVFLAILSIPSIACGVGLLRRRSWARGLALILAILNVFNPPLGTALAFYAFWVLLQPETQRMFA